MKIVEAKITYYNDEEKFERTLVFGDTEDVLYYFQHHGLDYSVKERSPQFLFAHVEHEDWEKWDKSYWHCFQKGVITYDKPDTSVKGAPYRPDFPLEQ